MNAYLGVVILWKVFFQLFLKTLKANGYDFDELTKRVSELFKIEVRQQRKPGKQPDRVKVRSVLAYWAVRELGFSGTAVGKKLGVSQSVVSRAVQRDEQIAMENELSRIKKRNA